MSFQDIVILAVAFLAGYYAIAHWTDSNGKAV